MMSPMTEPLTITVDELRRAMSIVFDRIEETMGPQIDLGADYYWHIGLSESFDMSTTPEGAPLAGQLTDDVESVRELISAGSDDYVALWHELDHIGGILRRVAALDLP